MKNTVAILAATDDKLFDWAGPRPVLEWTLPKLDGIRGVDSVVCVVSKAMADRAKPLLEKAEIEMVVLPDGLGVDVRGDVTLLRWLCSVGPAAKADFALLIRAGLPFLPACRMEECLEKVRSGRYDAAMTMRAGLVVDRPSADGQMITAVCSMRVDGVKAVRAAGFRGENARWPKSVAAVDVSFIESLDVSRGGLDAVKAMADAGAA